MRPFQNVVVRINDIMYVKCLAQYPGYSETCCWNVLLYICRQLLDFLGHAYVTFLLVAGGS